MGSQNPKVPSSVGLRPSHHRLPYKTRRAPLVKHAILAKARGSAWFTSQAAGATSRDSLESLAINEPAAEKERGIRYHHQRVLWKIDDEPRNVTPTWYTVGSSMPQTTQRRQGLERSGMYPPSLPQHGERGFELPCCICEKGKRGPFSGRACFARVHLAPCRHKSAASAPTPNVKHHYRDKRVFVGYVCVLLGQ